MFKIILLGWVGGIALMGIDFPLIMQYEKSGRALLLLAFIFIFINAQYSLADHFKGNVFFVMCSQPFVVGYQYAENALVERLQQREMDSKISILLFI